MKVICINNGGFTELIIGKEYECEEITGYYSNDNMFNKYYTLIINYLEIYPIELFLTIEEYRNRKLGELGI